jgi:hypothetical protein
MKQLGTMRSSLELSLGFRPDAAAMEFDNTLGLAIPKRHSVCLLQNFKELSGGRNCFQCSIVDVETHLQTALGSRDRNRQPDAFSNPLYMYTEMDHLMSLAQFQITKLHWLVLI